MKPIYAQDPREVGTYGIAEAARYVSLQPSTLRSWVLGRTSPAEPGRSSGPLIGLPDTAVPLLSFTNLVEAYVLAALRRRHGIKMKKVRDALSYLQRELGLPHPLATEALESDGTSLFLQRFGQLIDLPEAGQLALEPVLRPYLRRIERDESGLAARLFPLRRRADVTQAPRSVVIDPHVAFGKPVLTGTGVPTAVVFQRFDAGESIAVLAEDYGLSPSLIEEAIRYELPYERAA
ncbi:MAG TPA: DUF433 domain-containing protein [Thermoanaerobaculia bacterium]|nr:DUF433 domain-containing protein [Thermoanaerobaculia bacterium]